LERMFPHPQPLNSVLHWSKKVTSLLVSNPMSANLLLHCRKLKLAFELGSCRGEKGLR
jgi:hypothetical protein